MANDKIIVGDDIPEKMKAEVVAEQVYKVARANYNLRNICRVIDTGNDIHISIPIVDGRVSGQRNVGELEEAKISAQSYSTVDETLHKNVAHVVLSAESQLSANQDIMSMNADDAGQDIARMENEDIKDALTGAGITTEGADADWDNNDNDPFADIQSAMNVVRDENFNPDTILMDPDAYAILVTNQNVVDRLERGATSDGTINSISGLDIIVDNTLDSGTVYIMDTSKPVLLLADGPGMVNTYQNKVAMYDGYMIADFLHVEPVLTDAAVEITGITSQD